MDFWQSVKRDMKPALLYVIENPFLQNLYDDSYKLSILYLVKKKLHWEEAQKEASNARKKSLIAKNRLEKP